MARYARRLGVVRRALQARLGAKRDADGVAPRVGIAGLVRANAVCGALLRAPVWGRRRVRLRATTAAARRAETPCRTIPSPIAPPPAPRGRRRDGLLSPLGAPRARFQESP